MTTTAEETAALLARSIAYGWRSTKMAVDERNMLAEKIAQALREHGDARAKEMRERAATEAEPNRRISSDDAVARRIRALPLTPAKEEPANE